MKRNIFYKWGALLILCCTVLALYGQFLRNPYVFDDTYAFLLNGAGVQPLSTYRFEWLQLRSLPNASLAWTKAWLGPDLIYFRLGNLLCHAAVSCALYGFLKGLFCAALPSSAELNASTLAAGRLSTNGMALIAALMFALHPVATYAVGYLVQRTMLFATLFSLLVMWVWVKGITQDRSAWIWASLPLYYLAVFSKEHAITLVLVLPLLTVVLDPHWRQRLYRQAFVIALLLVIAAIAVLARKGIFGVTYEGDASVLLAQSDATLRYPLSVLTQAALFFKYGALWLLPNPAWMSIDMREQFASGFSVSSVFPVLAFLAWGGASLWLIFRRGEKALLGLAMAFPWLMYLTEFSTVRIQEVFVLYRSYLWAVGGLIAMPLLLQRVTGRHAVLLSAVIASAMFPVSMERLATMSHPILLWEDAAKLLVGRNDLPGAARIYYNRGTEYLKAGMLDKAISDLQLAADLYPNFSDAYSNLGVAYFKKWDWKRAQLNYTKAIEADAAAKTQPNAVHFANRAEAYTKMGEIHSAQSDYRESCRLQQLGCDKIH